MEHTLKNLYKIKNNLEEGYDNPEFINVESLDLALEYIDAELERKLQFSKEDIKDFLNDVKKSICEMHKQKDTNPRCWNCDMGLYVDYLFYLVENHDEIKEYLDGTL